MEPDHRCPDRRRLLTGAAALAASAALVPFTASGAGAAAHRPTPGGGAYPPHRWVPASPANFTAAKRPTKYPVEMVVVHVTQETYKNTLKLFKDPRHKAAAHYLVRSADGKIAQCVRERDVAWHAGNWDYNTRSIGIEHEGWIDDPTWFTDPLYEQSARLTAAICDRYRIPKDREHIIGHVEVPGTDHTDPGEFWDWARYLMLVNEASWRGVG
ncbi:N-acetylmuramoyl-L-alanine amidase [Streptomyces sp. 2224.1]|uniref:N-acetylmuramoyl-L-alanine amidase n=1 Tax=unclassified Streptomyces TaxID=2593676 RepID=UPI0008825251|nr:MULTISPECIES: N-acetylmuramoyl-L-alanine amidase [unclassified Streptomyces]PBC86375.1 N-acetylmuramoyl-L-alanine amidase [Streptomyces sp. 2321.6]SDQ86699.1 N-acetylmuramoyl-L-alanine amidase [Streptomyces sp. KS_16]SED93054.1 N-acetylmuramoyl-L-alanine amidase [Streptomyces sp. 2224.1]SED96474.1 N-acetylmuramoyl-L-alanine amidase [Streptomyces sp. 2133.1]SNC73257.1 N-acetylmuramoyl-L-alanine amidase [Streptomyces sp. 2114.4]